MRPHAVRTIVPVTLVALGAALSGCFTSAADFQHDAESFILEDERLVEGLVPGEDVTFVAATCAEPENQDVDTTFPCTGTDNQGRVWEFEVIITGKSGYEVVVSRRPDGV